MNSTAVSELLESNGSSPDFFSPFKLYKFSILYNDIIDTLLTSMLYVNMYWLMFIRIKEENKSKVFKYLSHCMILLHISRRKGTTFFRYLQIFLSLFD